MSAQSRAERNGRSTVRQPTARTTSSAITTICSMRCCDSIVATLLCATLLVGVRLLSYERVGISRRRSPGPLTKHRRSKARNGGCVFRDGQLSRFGGFPMLPQRIRDLLRYEVDKGGHATAPRLLGPITTRAGGCSARRSHDRSGRTLRRLLRGGARAGSGWSSPRFERTGGLA
jgi:hypothetical protein